MWILSKNAIKMAKGFTKHDVTKIQYPSDLTENIEEFKNQKEKNFPKKKKDTPPSFINFMQKSDIDKELIRLHLIESAYKIITEYLFNNILEIIIILE
jgi:hypothetical protein